MNNVLDEETKESINMWRVLRERAELTPDFRELKEEGKLHPVFVYGTLKQGKSNHALLKGRAAYAGRAYTATPLFQMKTNGGFPILFRDSQLSGKEKKATEYAVGELYYCPLNVMCDLDHLEGNGHMYQREKKMFFCCDQRFDNKENRVLYPHVKAWVYLGVSKYWQNKDNLDYCPILNIEVSPMKKIRAFNF